MDSGASAYMREDLYKRKFVSVWQELCHIIEVPDSIQVEHKNDKPYDRTSYPEINRRVQRLLKLDEFPDHYDIVELVERCNSKYNLGIVAEERGLLSRQIFKAVGTLLKDRRQRDFVGHFGNHLTDIVKLDDDPSHVDEQLLKQLMDNNAIGNENMERVCELSVSHQDVQEAKGTKDSDDEASDDQESSNDDTDSLLQDDRVSPLQDNPLNEQDTVEQPHPLSDTEPPNKKIKLSESTPPATQSHDTTPQSHDAQNTEVICIDSDNDDCVICLD